MPGDSSMPIKPLPCLSGGTSIGRKPLPELPEMNYTLWERITIDFSTVYTTILNMGLPILPISNICNNFVNNYLVIILFRCNFYRSNFNEYIMEKIETINLGRFRNNEHFQFMTDVNQLVITNQPSELAVESIYQAFYTALMAEDSAMRVELGSIKSKSIEDLDKLRDRTWNAISLRVNSCLLSPIANEVESATIIRRAIDLYGDLRAKSYNEETAGLSNLVADLQNESNTEHVDSIGIMQWIAELKVQNEQFQAIFNERNAEFAGRESGDVRAIRLQIDPLYQQLVEIINATLVMGIAKPAATSFVTQLNEKIKYYKTTLTAREGRNKTEKKTES